MGSVSASDLDKVTSFEQLVALLRDKLDWPISEDDGFEDKDIVFGYEAEEFGLKESEAAKIREIHQLRPLVTGQPWGVFFISLENKAIPVTVLRRILRALVVKKRIGALFAEHRAWDKSDLIFAAGFGRSGARELAFIHFSDGKDTGDLPILKVLGWNAKDTRLHNEHVAQVLSEKLVWPENTENTDDWRMKWASAFELRLHEVIETSRELAVQLAELASEIRARVNQLLKAEEETGPMRSMLAAFQKNLIEDLSEDDFADMFAQTIAYGLLAARISRESGIIIADNLADMVPRTNPFLKELFANFLKIGGRDKRRGLDFDEVGIRDVVDMLNAANMEAVRRDFDDRNPREDPVIHFYELFLKQYDPEKRMERGVFYTPRPVVRFITRGVDEILRKEFGLPLGLADTSTWAEVAARNDRIAIPPHVNRDAPFVQILDPATGTGTFLVEVIDLIHERMEGHWKKQGKSAAEIKKAWNDYVPRHLLPRLTAFELMMAPYTIAHMKIGLKLLETGYTFGSDERARIFLTNALEPARDLDAAFGFMSEALAHEAQASNAAKTETPVTVVIGNPPYSVFSRNTGEWIRDLIADYKREPGGTAKLKERKHSLDDDYVKFIRLSEHLIEKNGKGVLGFITNHGWLDNPTFRGMRWHLLESFEKFHIVDLHGNANKKEVTPEGKPDKNVFDIKQGVAITVGVRRQTGGKGDEGLAEVRHIDLWGSRENKYEFLSGATLDHPSFQTIEAPAPQHALVKRDFTLQAEYEKGFAVHQFMPVYSIGIGTSRDALTIDMEREALWQRVQDFAGLDPEAARAKYSLGRDTREGGWSVKGAQADLAAHYGHKHLTRINYRPFDTRWTYYTGMVSGFIFRPRDEVMRHMLGGKNLSLITARSNKKGVDHFFCSNQMPEMKCGESTIGSIFAPLYLYPDELDQTRRPNIDRTWALKLGEALGLAYEDGIPRDQQNFGPDFQRPKAEQLGMLDTPWDGRGDLEGVFGPRDLFDYIYAVLHSPGYRNRYAEFLKSDFPRIPMPGSRAVFSALVPVGRELVALHLLRADEAAVLKSPNIRFAGTGEARIEKGHPKYENGKVMINDTRWFEDVPDATWEFHIGGYQVCKKWLKDRAGKGGKSPSPGRILTDEDILHYRRTVTALTETRRLMAEIDRIIENHGGWPGAFTAESG